MVGQSLAAVQEPDSHSIYANIRMGLSTLQHIATYAVPGVGPNLQLQNVSIAVPCLGCPGSPVPAIIMVIIATIASIYPFTTRIADINGLSTRNNATVVAW